MPIQQSAYYPHAHIQSGQNKSAADKLINNAPPQVYLSDECTHNHIPVTCKH